MAELDYAYLADFAVVQEGKLNAIGASFTHVVAAEIPTVLQLSVAGRIRATQGEDVSVGLEIVPPNAEYEFRVDGSIADFGNLRPYGDNQLVGLLFTFGTQIAIPASGLYQVYVSIEGERVRRLAFDVEPAATP